ncbi:hypothetical protein [Patulibacter minatonensis]|uniref:hypothetical protein n=1 Tax=Patulibacter minatonensis TaxID=298163 RepID=UPI00047ADEF5|nr:hypothetical protein [Patulibacter minatonensis]
MSRGPALRRAGVTIVLVVAVVLVLVLGRDDEPSPFRGPTTDDPVAALCRSASDRSSSACTSAYFACRGHRGRIVRDAELPVRTSDREVVAAYVQSDWSAWEGPVRDAAQRGCRAGLRG